MIESVRPGSSAANAGLRPANPRSGDVGDVIVAVNGRRIETPSQFANELDRAGIGRDAELTLVRAGEERRVRVRVIDLAP
ncbi:MAG: PDZ domain-containing protein [Burkholderiaceae bacterium]|nr:PDZ domain-containing protein [Burkholderiaceae bacterium]